MVLAQGPKWSPPGDTAPTEQWRYSLRRNGWVPPGKKANADDTQLVQPIGWNPRDRDKQYQIVVSPPGVTPPSGAYSWTPDTKEVHAPGTNAPIDKINLSLVPAGSAIPPVGVLPSSPLAGGAAAGPVPLPVAPPAFGAGVTPPVAPGQGPTTLSRGGGTTPPPAGLMAPGPVSPPGLAPGAPPPTAPMQTGPGGPTPPGAAPGGAAAPDPFAPDDDPELVMRQILAAMTGDEHRADEGVGVGQDAAAGIAGRAPALGVGADDLTDLQTDTLQAATRRHVGTRYVLGGNDLTKGIDCSGFVNEILRGFGARIPGRPSTVTYRNELATPVSWDDIRPGDILLSAPNPRDPVSGEHMALYVGGGQMAESRGGVGVRIGSVQGTNLQPYRMRESVPGLQDATLLSRRAAELGVEHVTPQNADQVRLASVAGGGNGPSAVAGMANRQPSGNLADVPELKAGNYALSPWHGFVKENAGDLAGDTRFIAAVSAIHLAEARYDPQARGDRDNPSDPNTAHSLGLYQMHDRGAGAGVPPEVRMDPARSSQIMVPQLARAYQEITARAPNASFADIVRYLADQVERPNWAAPGVSANYAQAARDTEQGTAWQRPDVQPAIARWREIVRQAGPEAVALTTTDQAIAQGPNLPQELLGTIQRAAQAVAQQVAQTVNPPSAQAAELGPSTMAPAVPPSNGAQIATPNDMVGGRPVGPRVELPAAPGSAVADQRARAAANPPAPPPPAAAPPPAAVPSVAPPVQPGSYPPVYNRAADFGYQPPSAPASSAPPAPPPPEAARSTPPPGWHYSDDYGMNIPDTPGYYSVAGGTVFWDGMRFTQPSAQSQRPPVQAHQIAPGTSIIARPDGSMTVTHQAPNGTLYSAPVDADGNVGEWGTVGRFPDTLTAEQSANLALQRDQLALAQQRRDDEMARFGSVSGDTQAQLEQRRREFENVSATTAAELRQRQAQFEGVSGNTSAELGARREQWQAELANRQAEFAGVSGGTQAQIESARGIHETPSGGELLRARQPFTVGRHGYTWNPDTNSVEESFTVPREPQIVGNRVVQIGDDGNVSVTPLPPEQMSEYESGQLEVARGRLGLEQQQSERNYGIQQQELGLKGQELGLRGQEMQSRERIAQQQLQQERQKKSVVPGVRGGISVVDPFTGQTSMTQAPEPEEIRQVGGNVLIPAGRTVTVQGVNGPNQTVSGGPDPYAALRAQNLGGMGYGGLGNAGMVGGYPGGGYPGFNAVGPGMGPMAVAPRMVGWQPQQTGYGWQPQQQQGFGWGQGYGY